MLEEAGFQDIEITAEQMGFFQDVDRAKQWNGGWFHPTENPLLKLTSKQMNNLKESYSEYVEAQATDRGVWCENMTFFAIGRKRLPA